ncbi:FAD binding domain protein [Apiospora phragmitis]|uniref:FAD binding domain protein n=1 Tax=Apiospora phragmitis TaxID=2905665 RepID=A0ABR1URV9_9PEZI
MALASCCDALSSALAGNVFLPNTADYASANNKRWSFTSVLSPSCVVAPATTQDRYTKANNKDQSAGMQTIFKLGSDGNDQAEALYGHHLGLTSMAPVPILSPAIFNELLMIQPQTIAIAAPLPINVLSGVPQAAQADGYRDGLATITFQNDQNTINAVHSVTQGICSQVADIPNLDCFWSYVPLPDAVTANSLKRGRNLLGLEKKRIDRMVVFFSPRWQDALYDDRMANVSKAWYSQAKAATVAQGTADDFLYLNFAGGFQDPISSYGADNLAFLRRGAFLTTRPK